MSTQAVSQALPRVQSRTTPGVQHIGPGKQGIRRSVRKPIEIPFRPFRPFRLFRPFRPFRPVHSYYVL